MTKPHTAPAEPQSALPASRLAPTSGRARTTVLLSTGFTVGVLTAVLTANVHAHHNDKRAVVAAKQTALSIEQAMTDSRHSTPPASIPEPDPGIDVVWYQHDSRSYTFCVETSGATASYNSTTGDVTTGGCSEPRL